MSSPVAAPQGTEPFVESSSANGSLRVVAAQVGGEDEFLDIVAALAGERNARHYGALLLTSAHGIAGMELSGHLDTDKWHTTADELVDTLVRVVTDAGE
ncbi:hypothetical protein [Streptomyces sp. WG5]|uniref:hypothetical protein n=1 Tax=Streptomyces sp. WG5 TaxID=3417648 RepID=UPI003CE93FF1